MLLNNQISSLCARGLLRNSKEKETCNEENLILGGLFVCFILKLYSITFYYYFKLLHFKYYTGWLRWSINNNTNDTIPYLYHEFGLSTTKNVFNVYLF